MSPPARGGAVGDRRRVPALIAAAVAFVTACAPPPDAIAVEGRSVRVLNQTGVEWTDVEVWVNHHYRATARSLAPGGQLVVPKSSFVAGFGQRFDPARQHVELVRVKAKSAAGDVALEWDDEAGMRPTGRP